MRGRLKQQARGLVNVRQASRLLKIDEFNVYAAIWRGALRGIKWRGQWRIPYHEIQRYAARRGKQGTPK